MNEVIIISDSTCDLTKELIEKNNIKIVPLYVNFGKETYRDGLDITTEKMYELIEEKNLLPKTAAPSPAIFIDFFKPFIDKGKDIVYIGISSKLSSTLQSAIIAASEFPEGRIHIVDSLNLSSGIGLLVLKATKFAQAGLSAEDVAKNVANIVPNIETAFVIDTLDYLHKGGRCSSLANFMGTVLKIKPIIHVVDGGMIVGQKPRGKKKAYEFLLQKIYNDKDRLDDDFVMVTHSLADDAAQYLKDELKSNLNIKEVLETKAGCVISSHCGEGTIGILYITK